MKNEKKQFASLSIALLTLGLVTGCEPDSNTSSSGQSSPISLSGDFYNYSVSDDPKNESVSSVNYTIGTFLLDENDRSLLEGNSNIPYIRQEGSLAFNPAQPDKMLRTSPDGKGTWVIAYAPYRENLEGTNLPLDLSAIEESKTNDLYYAISVQPVYMDKSYANILLRPVLSYAKFQFNAVAGINEEQLNGAVIDILGTNNKAVFNLMEGRLENEEQTAPISLSVSDETRETVCALLPSASVDGHKLKVILPGIENGERVWNISEKTNIKEYKPGWLYTFNVNVGPSSLDLTIDETPAGEWGNNGQDIIISKPKENLLKYSISEQPLGNIPQITSYNLTDEQWFYRPFKGEENSSSAKVVDDGSLRVLHIEMCADKDVTATDKLAGYYVRNVKSGIYTVKFKAKRLDDNSNGKDNAMKCYVRTQVGRYFTSTSNKGDIDTGCKADKSPDNNYKEYSFKVDFSKTAPNTWSSGDKDSTPADLEGAYIGFGFNHAPGNLYIYDLRLVQ